MAGGFETNAAKRRKLLSVDGIQKVLQDNGSEPNQKDFETLLEWISKNASPKQVRQIELTAKKIINSLNEKSKEPLRKTLLLQKQRNNRTLLCEQFYENGSRKTRSLSKKALNEINLSQYSIAPSAMKYLKEHGIEIS